MAGIDLGTLYASLELRTGRLEQGLTDAQRKLDKTGREMKSRADAISRDLSGAFGNLGRTLTVGLTAPLAALGAASVRAAVDMDSLKRGLRAVAGSSAETERQLVRLREVAKLPGLGFQEAIRGATTLQAAGLSAQMAERALKGFGNALATVGKGKDDLDGVIRALSQIQSKGKISAEEINQLAERVPQIRVMLKEAFGTADTEVLQKAKIGVNEFFDAIVTRAEKLPQVVGGAQNSFENFSDSAKQALSQIGDIFLPAVTQALDRISPILERIAKGFSDLPKWAQTGLGGLAIGGAFIGPALLGLAAVANSVISIRAALIAASVSGAALISILGKIALLIPVPRNAEDSIRRHIEERGSPELRRALIDADVRAGRIKPASIGGLRALEGEQAGRIPIIRRGPSIDAIARAAAASARAGGGGGGSSRADKAAQAAAKALREAEQYADDLKALKLDLIRLGGDQQEYSIAQALEDFYEGKKKKMPLDLLTQRLRLSAEAAMKSFEQTRDRWAKAYQNLGPTEEDLKKVALDRAKKYAAALSDAMTAALSAVRVRFMPEEARPKPLTDVLFEDTLNPTVNQDTEANALASANRTITPKAIRKAGKRLGNDLGKIIGQEMSYSITEGLAKTLDKAFGKSDIGKIFARSLVRWVERELDDAMDKLFTSIGRVIKGKRGGATAGGGEGASFLPGSMPGGYPGGAGMGVSPMLLASLIYGKNNRKMQNAGIGSMLGSVAGMFIPGVGPLLGGTLGGLLGGLFAEGGSPPVGRWSLVGERGPELIKPMTPTTILPNAALAGAGVNVTITGNTFSEGMDVRAFARSIAREIELSQRVRPGR